MKKEEELVPARKLWRTLGFPEPKSEASRGKLSLVDNEVYSGIEVPEKMLFFVRLDGWAFHGLAQRLQLRKPFDERFADCLAKTAEAFFVPFNPCLAYIFSDEINFLFAKPTSFTRIEKIDSVFAGFASSAFSALAARRFKKQVNAAFDCRVVPVRRNEVLKYLVWRQAEAFRNHNNSWTQFILTSKAKLSPRAANKRLAGLKTKQLYALSKKYGVDLRKTPAWQRNGLMLHWQAFKKKGFDPIKKKRVAVKRRKPIEDWAPPSFNAIKGKRFLADLIKEST